MYTPPYHRITDRNECIAFMKRYNFGVIITTKDNAVTGTHLPFVITEEGDGVVIYGHCARANKQWQEMEQNKVLVIFSEPNAYISPGYYEHKINVPTWNYAAVHAYGDAKLIESPDGITEVLERSFDFFEPEYKEQWESLPGDYINDMLKGVVAFKVLVTDLQGKKKLSQNRTGHERQVIIESFSSSPDYHEKEIAELMKKLEI